MQPLSDVERGRGVFVRRSVFEDRFRAILIALKRLIVFGRSWLSPRSFAKASGLKVSEGAECRRLEMPRTCI